jgi:glucose uptake protein GlcU
MRTKTVRGYVWVFCLYLSSTVEWLSHLNRTIRPPHVDRSFFFTLFPNALGPVVLALIFLLLLRETENWVEKAVLILSAMTFVFSAVFALHQFGYIAMSSPHSLSGLSFFIATALLGYRTDQILKQQDKGIEISACSTLS